MVIKKDKLMISNTLKYCKSKYFSKAVLFRELGPAFDGISHWFGLVWFGLVWFGLVWFGLV